MYIGGVQCCSCLDCGVVSLLELCLCFNLFLAFLSGLYEEPGAVLTAAEARVNGEPALIFYNKQSGTIDTMVMLAFDGNSVAAMYFMRNPDKLTPAV
jgi:hypothetical protein